MSVVKTIYIQANLNHGETFFLSFLFFYIQLLSIALGTWYFLYDVHGK